MEDFTKYYDLESYLFKTVKNDFKERGFLTAFDFFCIVIWKANRAKTKIAEKLLKKRPNKNLNDIVKEFSTELARKTNPKDNLQYLFVDWGFRLPMASAILSVLYPEEFTIYDVRVCNILKEKGVGDFSNLTNINNFNKLWEGYERFKHQVKDCTPTNLTLRDKDRYLWGKSFYKQLKKDIKQKFNVSKTPVKTDCWYGVC
ncbi:MAG: hypothetical protein AB1599_04475 [Planctomycetota bacterium]